MGESERAPQGAQGDLNSSIITESQAAAMSPDCRVPVELSLFLPLSLALLPLLLPFFSHYFFFAPPHYFFCAPPLYLSFFGSRDRSRLGRCSGPLACTSWQGPIAHTHPLSLTHTHRRACTQAGKKKKKAGAQTHIDRDRNSLVSYLSTAHVAHTCKAFT